MVEVSSALQKLQREMEALAGTLPLTAQPGDIVPGEGSSTADVFLIGEAPGFHEQQQRRPFVGRSGQLLRSVLQDVSLPLTSVYISNIVKARPPENRDPTPVEIAAFAPFLDQEIALVKPKLIVTLGRFSMAKFLPKVKISQVHGRLHRVVWKKQTHYILPMYHPAAALRSTATKQAFITDFKKVLPALEWLNQSVIPYSSDVL